MAVLQAFSSRMLLNVLSAGPQGRSRIHLEKPFVQVNMQCTRTLVVKYRKIGKRSVFFTTAAQAEPGSSSVPGGADSVPWAPQHCPVFGFDM